MPDEPDRSGSEEASQRSPDSVARVEAQAPTVGAAKWAAMKELELTYPGITVDQVGFEVIEEGDERDEAAPARVAATADLGRWREAESEFAWPDEPTERVRAILRRLIAHLGLRGSVDVVEHEAEIVADVSGPELGLLIGKHGSTLDAIQSVCGQAAYRGAEDRKRVVVDAAGYRERREAALRRQADRGAADALRYGRPVELDSMSAQERRVVHEYLKERPDVETHSEGDEPFRRIVVTPVAGRR